MLCVHVYSGSQTSNQTQYWHYLNMLIEIALCLIFLATQVLEQMLQLVTLQPHINGKVYKQSQLISMMLALMAVKSFYKFQKILPDCTRQIYLAGDRTNAIGEKV